MRVTLTHGNNFVTPSFIDIKKVVIEDNNQPLLDRETLIERVNALLDQYETKDARPI